VTPAAPTPPVDPTPDPTATPVPPEGAVGWLRRELSDEGGGRILPTIGSGLGILRLFSVGVFVLGVVAAILSFAAFRDDTGLLIFTLLLCLPAVVAPIVAMRSLSRLRAAVTHPQELGRQLRDLVSGLTDGPEVRELVGRFRGKGGRGPVSEGGRLRRTIRTGRLVSSVVGAAEPDPQRHNLLLAFTPERTGRMFLSFTWTAWGILLAIGALTMAVAGIIVAAL
jgi:hypothetical protein